MPAVLNRPTSAVRDDPVICPRISRPLGKRSVISCRYLNNNNDIK